MIFASVIPYFTLPPIGVGDLKLQPFGIAVATGVLVGSHLTRRYAEKNDLSVDVITRMIPWLVIVGFPLAHWFDVFTYQPAALLEDPWLFFKIWQGISSVGGMLGGVVGFLLFFHYYRREGHSRMRYADACAIGMVSAWVFGRLGCTIVHDHPGQPSEFLLAIEFKDGIARHDLGFYEFLWLITICTVVFILARNKDRPRGLLIAVLPLMYGPVRFAFDFLRVGAAEGGDARYFGLTPAHYMSIVIFFTGAALLWFSLKHGRDPLPDPVEKDEAEQDEEPQQRQASAAQKQKGKKKRKKRK